MPIVIKSAVRQAIAAIRSVSVYLLKTLACVQITETASLNYVKMVFVAKKRVRGI